MHDVLDRTTQTDEVLETGTRVEVRSRVEAGWARGFEIHEHVDGGYRLRRLSDGEVLPLVFDEDDVRPEKKKQGLWWY